MATTSAPAPRSPATDRDLLLQVAQGSERAIAELFDRYGMVLFAVAHRILGERADAEEAVSDAFAQVWRDAGRFQTDRGSVAAWITTIGRSRALDLVRARSRRARITATAARKDTEQAPAMSAWRPDPGRGVEAGERRRFVEAALADLSPPQRQAIELAYYEGLSQTEIAERLQEPLGTVKTRVRLGMQKLREALRPYYGEPDA